MWLIQEKLSRVRGISFLVENPRYLVATLAGTVVLAVAAGVGMSLDSWAWGLGLAAVGILVVLVLLLAWALLRQKERERLTQEDEAEDAALGERRRQMEEEVRLRELTRRVQRAVDELRSAQLDRDLDFPWVMLVGPPGAGKSAALREAELDLPAEYRALVGEGPTHGADFWLTNEGVVVDLEGALLDADSGPLRTAWRTVLRALRRARPRLPLNGLVVALSVPYLLGHAPRQLEEEARRFRRRLNELRDYLRLDLPIYVLLTQCDQLQGFVELSGHVAPKQLREALGWTCGERVLPDAGEAVRDGLDELRERLDEFLPEMLQRESDPVRQRRLLLLPAEVGELSQALSVFAGQLFKPSIRDEEGPFLRGVYLASALRGGSLISPVLRRLNQEWAQASVPPGGPSGGNFLSEVFREIVFGDASLAVPTRGLGQLGRRIVIGVAAVATVAAIAMWGLAFQANYAGLQRVSRETRGVVSVDASLPALERLRTAIQQEQDAGKAWRRRLGFGGRLRAGLGRARRSYVWAFSREFDEPTKANVTSSLRAYDDRSFEALATLALDITWLAAAGDPAAGVTLPPLCPWAPIGSAEADCKSFGDSYVAYTHWLDDVTREGRIDAERQLVYGSAGTLLTIERLERWSATHPEQQPPVRYADVGLPTPASKNGTSTEVSGAYTRKAWETLVRPLIDAVDRSGGASQDQIREFRRSYARNFDQAWRRFLLDAPLEPVNAARPQDSPYVHLVEMMGANVRADVQRPGPRPEWMTSLDHFLPPEAPAPAAASGPGAPAAPAPAASAGKAPPAQAEPAKGPWQDYEDLLAQASEDVDVEGASQGKDSVFSQALERVRKIFPGSGDSAEDDKLRHLLAMPVLARFAAATGREMDSLDQRWRDRIAVPFGGKLDANEFHRLYAPNTGALDRFLSEDLAPYFDAATGRPKRLIGGQGLGFGPTFLSWVQNARELQQTLFTGFGGAPRQATVRVDGIPSRIAGGKLFLARRELSMTCGGRTQTFVYQEGNGSMAFQWSPDCTEVDLRLWARAVGEPERELTPRRVWTGPMAFPEFLQSGRSRGGGRYDWKLHFDQVPNVEISYGVHGAEGLAAARSRPPPRSMRD